ncbi:LysM peptidoglycan-binding domain-containing protein [Arthrobacter cryoconiti]|uniref:LysM peptidoglycan-binding domain-containing protein n=1 Tax=Arthrobacter cryoconiti TaxID=748907 RepID=A0ABV8R439_9MICC|nr:LysM peptidoglycan-binding domain-containing protein [Arthrobacter cryoconiti]MCC9069360.1 LysM peptidoglycan-binding domain-containing protein [Arthrobacter cryoconiti]
MKKLVSGVAALIGLAVLLVGIPAALIALAGNPIPSIDQAIQGFTQPDWTGSFTTGHVLPIIGWIAWASFAIGILSVIPAMVRGIEPPQIKGLALQQNTGRALIGAVIIMITSFGGVAAASASEAPAIAPVSISVQQSTQIQAPAAATKQAPAETKVASAPTVTVQNGDSLWSLAESYLGDGNRFNEIAQLNYGAPQPDGGSLSENHFINAGWTIKLPADASVSNDKALTVSVGDTLESLAQAEYGDASKSTVIFNASQSIVQFDGTQIGTTQQILPGYRLVAPNVKSTAAPLSSNIVKDAPAVTPAPAPEAAAPEAPTGAAATPAATEADTPAPSAPEQTTQVTAPADTGSTESDSTSAVVAEDAGNEFPVATLWGAGGILAAGILSVLGARRFRQQRRRKAGERIAMPAQDIAVTELELRAAEDPAGVDDIDQSLHFLATWAFDNDLALPKLFAVRLSPQTVEVYLDQPASLPAPFEAVSDDDCAWSIDPRKLPDFEPKTASPYPALVTLGQDAADGHILVDLEQIGALNLAGDPEMTQGALTALAIELACSKWSEELRVSIVGFAPELPSAFDTGRVRYIKDVQELVSNLAARAAQDAELLRKLDIDSSHDARISAKTEDSWPPEIILLVQMPDDETAQKLATLIQDVPRVGIAAITQGHLAGEWSLEIANDRTAKLTPAGIELQAQIVAGDNYTNILSALRSTVERAVQAPPVQRETSINSVIARPIEESAPADPETEEEALPAAEMDAVDLDAVPNTPALLIDLEARSRRPKPVDEEIRIELPDAPFVRVLGNVRIENTKGVNPGCVSGGSTARATEVIAFLALHRKQSTEEYDQAIHPNKSMTASMRNPLISRARKWLDSTADGQDFLAKFDVAKSYTLLDEVRTDWDIFQELVGEDAATASLARLEAALELVTGQPFQGVKAARGAWGWSEIDQQEMIAAISDVAYEVAERARETNDPALMLKASLRGSMVNPASEIHKRHKLLAFALNDDKEGFERTVQQIFDQCEAMEEDGPEQETLDLIRQLEGRLEKLKAS